ncbi:GGDEF domain-containing protein [Bradyrhizobium sp. JYMT SZCCT0180]|uniref:GGDEF domain-containing protein n=1 Tax=Bradyrhizobium sp. JYMT SZCCT0180 TaxID=2807666 RepID=UPI001BA6A1F8|nr:GGDEF domain-containing protein [Bradyrhizobium sp. JYMT SZCCT0180]MBR1209595.1 GGDEF domain-containing protein [Bradyrhizobium sp. JYMT SZCCT0180]
MRSGSSSLNATPLDDAADVLVTPALEAETERLLSQRTRDIRFSPEMVRAYRSKDWPQRSKIARAWMVWVGLISMAFVPISYLLAPDFLIHTTIISGLLVPAMHGCAYLVWRKPRSAAVEGLALLLLMTSVMIAYGFLAVAAGGNYERFLTCIMYVNTIAIVVFSVDYLWTLSLMICSIGIFFGFEIFNPVIESKEAVGTSIFYAMGMYAATIARKTQSILGQKAFLLSLRNQYRSDALRRANHQLEILATRDPLTGLGNRRSATDLIDRLWRDPTVPKASIAFIMADIDLFKHLNDTAGHAAGDACIRRVADTIEDSVRLGLDAVFRYGGEEFLVVLAHATPDLAWTIAQRIRSAVEGLGIVNPGIHPADDSTCVVTISLGVAFAQENAAPEMVAKWADDALYDAKRGGRNIVFLSNAHAAGEDARDAQAVAVQPRQRV